MGKIYILDLNKRRMIIIWQGFIQAMHLNAFKELAMLLSYNSWVDNTLPRPLGKSTHPVVGKKRVNAMV